MHHLGSPSSSKALPALGDDPSPLHTVGLERRLKCHEALVRDACDVAAMRRFWGSTSGIAVAEDAEVLAGAPGVSIRTISEGIELPEIIMEVDKHLFVEEKDGKWMKMVILLGGHAIHLTSIIL